MIYFTSDLHLGEDRIGIGGKSNLFYRPFSSIEEQNDTIIGNFRKIDETDEVYFIGDLVYNPEYIHLLKNLGNFKKYLIAGNYDQKILKEIADLKIFSSIKSQMTILLDKFTVLLNHYPTKCIEEMRKDAGIHFSITGHIHSLWKVQRKMINASTDAWHFKPVSSEEILFCWNAMQNFYDENVFPY